MNETEINQMIEQIGYTEVYRHSQEKDNLIRTLNQEIESLNNNINKFKRKIQEVREDSYNRGYKYASYKNKDHYNVALGEVNAYDKCLDMLNILVESKGDDNEG